MISGEKNDNVNVEEKSGIVQVSLSRFVLLFLPICPGRTDIGISRTSLRGQ